MNEDLKDKLDPRAHVDLLAQLVKLDNQENLDNKSVVSIIIFHKFDYYDLLFVGQTRW